MSQIVDERIAGVVSFADRQRAARSRQHSNADRGAIKGIILFIAGWFLIGATYATISSLT